MRRQAVILSLLALVAGLLGACNPSQGAPQVWIDMPLNASNLPLFPMWVGSHAADPAGIAQVELSVNDAVVANTFADPAPEDLLYTQQLWKPTAPGTYTLKVRARNLKGAWGQALAVVTIGQQATSTPTTAALVPTATPTPMASATEVPTATVTATAIPAATSTPTMAPTATATPTSPPPPTATPTSTPVPTAIPTVPAPTIGRHSVSTDQFFYGDSSCGPKEVTIGVDTSDATGVKIYYCLADKATNGVTRWASRDMNAVRGGWTCTIGSADISGYDQSLNVSYWFQFYFVAANSGGETKAPVITSAVTLSRCTQIR